MRVWRLAHESDCNQAFFCNCPVVSEEVKVLDIERASFDRLLYHPPITWGRGPVADLIDMQRKIDAANESMGEILATKIRRPLGAKPRGYIIYCETCLLVGDCITSEMAESLQKVHKLATGHETIIKETV